MDPKQADAVFEALTLEQHNARADAERMREANARALAGQKRMAVSVFLGFGAGAGPGYLLVQQWELPGLCGAGLGLLFGAWLRGRKA